MTLALQLVGIALMVAAVASPPARRWHILILTSGATGLVAFLLGFILARLTGDK